MGIKLQTLAKDEHAVQSAIVTFATLNAGKWPVLRLLFSVPNGAAFGSEVRTLRSGRKVPVAAMRSRRMKAEGLKNGVPDLCLPVARRGCHGLFLEVKTTTGRVRPEQVEWIEALREQGYHAVVARGFEDAVAVLRWYVSG